MKFDNRDFKSLLINMFASFSAIIIQDIIKKENKIFNYEKNR